MWGHLDTSQLQGGLWWSLRSPLPLLTVLHAPQACLTSCHPPLLRPGPAVSIWSVSPFPPRFIWARATPLAGPLSPCEAFSLHSVARQDSHGDHSPRRPLVPKPFSAAWRGQGPAKLVTVGLFQEFSVPQQNGNKESPHLGRLSRGTVRCCAHDTCPRPAQSWAGTWTLEAWLVKGQETHGLWSTCAPCWPQGQITQTVPRTAGA